jgi:inorganic pyrophosphatase
MNLMRGYCDWIVIFYNDNDELIEEIRNMTALLLDCQKELRATQQELENLKKRDETIRLKKSIAGKKGGRGNES